MQERERIEQRAKDFGMSLSDFIRFAALTVEPQEAVRSAATVERLKDVWDSASLKEQFAAPHTLPFKCPVCDRRYMRQIRCSCSNRLAVSA